MQKISSCLWFDGQAEEAASYYTQIFPDSRLGKRCYYSDEGKEIHGQEAGSLLTLQFQLAGSDFIALNGGPHFRFNPSINFFVLCESKEEVDSLWSQLSEGGEVMMPLDKYDWSDYYGWVSDRFGVSWQLFMGNMADVGQKIVPLFFFTGATRGKAKQAHDFYLEVFKNSSSDGVLKYDSGEAEGMVMHSQFRLEGQTFMAMDSGVENDFPFNEAVSLMINCRTQEEVNHYWEKLLQNGGSEQQCGWLKDQFGVSWQVVPEELSELFRDPDPEKRSRVMRAMLQMKKLDIDVLKQA